MIDDRQTTSSSQLDGLPILSRESNTFGWQSYLGDLYGSDDVPYAATPASATDLSGLPAAFISVGSVVPNTQRWLVLAVLCIALLVVGIDGPIVNIALPSLEH